jgi:dihydroorotase-like cyclic amidohydrolase
MTFNLIFRNARIAGAEDHTVDIGIRGGGFAAIEARLADADGPALDLAGRLVTPGLVEIPTQSVQLFTTKRQKG